MENKNIQELSGNNLPVEKSKFKDSRLFYAISIGFLAGVLIFGVVSWMLSEEKRIGALIPMAIPVVFIYKMLKKPNKDKQA